jgi:hypothetical protein
VAVVLLHSYKEVAQAAVVVAPGVPCIFLLRRWQMPGLLVQTAVMVALVFHFSVQWIMQVQVAAAAGADACG